MDLPLRSGYQAQLAHFRLAFSRTGCMLSTVLIAAGVGLDYAFYPDRMGTLAVGRAAGTAVSLAVLWALYRPDAVARVRGLTLVWLLLPQLMISWMIYATQGAASPYVFGLSLALYAAGIIMPIGFLQSVALGGFTCAAYAVACWAQGGGGMAAFVGNLIFLLFSATISAGCTFYNERGRVELFQLQHEVSEKNATLQDTNRDLAQIKGHMIQQEKMAALGTLSAGLLHEVNNPVNYSMMAINMAMTDPAVAASPDLKESLADAKEGMQRVQNIVTDLKTFAYQKPGEDANRVFLFEKAVHSSERLTGFELKGIALDVQLPLDTHVRGDEPALIGVLINLFSNAALAIRKAERAKPSIVVHGEHRGGRLHITVRDNGTGIRPENLTRVFEPFFTTRDVGQGLGLGLSVSYAIVQRHGGELTVTSEEGAWTQFAFDLALANPQA